MRATPLTPLWLRRTVGRRKSAAVAGGGTRRMHAVRRFVLVVALQGFAALSTAPAQPPAATGAEVPERPFPATTAAGAPRGAGGTPAEGPTGDFQDLLETRVAELRDDTGLTAVAVAVTIDGDLAAAAVSGERRRDSGIPVTVGDRWHLGSITKSMTATLLAVLEEDGLLSADDALTALLPDVGMADGRSACTPEHLMTHTAGVAANFPAESRDVWPETAEELVAERRRFIADALAEEPGSPCGERFLYSNVGYTIAGHIAETIAREPYETLLQDRVFAPLALMSAGFGAPKGEHPDQEPLGHRVFPNGRRVPVDPFEGRADNSPLIAPAGTVHMTIGDLARYGAAHLDGETGNDPVLLSRSSWQRLHAPFLNDYARGWVRHERDWAGGPVIWHDGSNTLWYALLMLLPAKNMTLAFVTNDGASVTAGAAFNELAQELTALRDRLDPPNRPPEAVGTLPAVRLPGPGATLEVDVRAAFGDPDGDPLTYAASSSAPRVVAARVAGARVTLTAAGIGPATIEATATDPDGLSARQAFPAEVAAPGPDDPIRPGVTPVRAVHFTALRTRIDEARSAAGLPAFPWTDPVLTPGRTPVRLVHLLDLRQALGAAYAAGGRPAPAWTDAAPVAGTTPIRAAHLIELRAAVLALE